MISFTERTLKHITEPTGKSFLKPRPSGLWQLQCHCGNAIWSFHVFLQRGVKETLSLETLRFDGVVFFVTGEDKVITQSGMQPK